MEQLKARCEIKAPVIATRQDSADGTIKFAIHVGEGQEVETVYIPEDDRATLCVSSQVGCALECTFCSTAQQGFNQPAQGGFGQQNRAPMEPTIDFDDDIPF